MRLKWLRVLSFFPQEKRQKSSEDSSKNHISPFREPLTQLNNRPEYLDSDKHVRFKYTVGKKAVCVIVIVIQLIIENVNLYCGSVQ